ncbi:MAG: hypothetical protein M4D80_40845 [Myxococcota bacterium]|nr:hypothetical protein [Deltaproteobacteria bacterium]MDQ3341542.1 hypothetical protein [Myxococcota bacterium]
MRKVVFAALFAATGCVASDGGADDDGDGVANIDDFCPGTPGGAAVDIDGCSFRPAPGLITANWSFKQLSTGGNLACPTGFNTTAVHVTPVNRFGDKTGTEIIDLYNCSAMSGTADYDARLYSVFLEITTQTNSAKYADTPSAFVDITNVDKSITQTIIDDGGFFVFDFSLRDANGGAQLSCAEAGAGGGVEIVSTLNGTSSAKTDIFDCVTPGFRDDGKGYATTAGLIAGDYTVSVAALNNADQSVGTAPALTNKRISAPNKLTDLGSIQIPID